jgi:hypothetical protein
MPNKLPIVNQIKDNDQNEANRHKELIETVSKMIPAQNNTPDAFGDIAKNIREEMRSGVESATRAADLHFKQEQLTKDIMHDASLSNADRLAEEAKAHADKLTDMDIEAAKDAADKVEVLAKKERERAEHRADMTPGLKGVAMRSKVKIKDGLGKAKQTVVDKLKEHGTKIAIGAGLVALESIYNNWDKIAAAWNDVKESLSSYVNKIPSIFPTIAAVTAAWSKWGNSIKASSVAITESVKKTKLGGALFNASNAVKEFSGNIASRINTITDTIKNSKAWNLMKAATSSIGNVIKSVGAVAKTATIAAATGGLSLLMPKKDEVAKAAKAAKAGTLGTTLSKAGTFLGKFATILGKIAWPLTAVMGIYEGFRSSVDDFKAGDIGTGILNFNKGVIKSVIGAPLDLIKSVISWIVGFFGGTDLEKKMDEFSFSESIDNIFKAIPEFFAKIGQLVRDLLPSWETIKAEFGDFWKDPKGYIVNAFNSFKLNLPSWETIKAEFGDFWKDPKGYIVNAFNSFKLNLPSWETIKESMPKWLTNFGGWMGSKLNTYMLTLPSWETIKESMPKWLTDFGGWMGSKLNTYMLTLPSWETIKESMPKWLTDFGGWMGSKLNTYMLTLPSWETVKTGLSEFWKDPKGYIVKSFTNWKLSLPSWETIKMGLSEFWQNPVKYIQNKINGWLTFEDDKGVNISIFDKITSMVDEYITNPILDLFDTIGNALDNIKLSVMKWVEEKGTFFGSKTIDYSDEIADTEKRIAKRDATKLARNSKDSDTVFDTLLADGGLNGIEPVPEHAGVPIPGESTPTITIEFGEGEAFADGQSLGPVTYDSKTAGISSLTPAQSTADTYKTLKNSGNQDGANIYLANMIKGNKEFMEQVINAISGITRSGNANVNNSSTTNILNAGSPYPDPVIAR